MTNSIDSEIISYSQICLICKHYKKNKGCAAFKNIPIQIWTGENPHTSPYPGDSGITFEKMEQQS